MVPATVLVTLLALALVRALQRPTVLRLVVLGLLCGLLLLTHYWALYLIAGLGTCLVVGSLWGPLRANARFESTNWTRIHDYYLELEKLKPSSVIRLNLAIVTGKKDGPRAALRLLHILERNHVLDNYYLLDASLGEFYQLLGQKEEALFYFRRARELTRSTAIREVLDKKIARL